MLFWRKVGLNVKLHIQVLIFRLRKASRIEPRLMLPRILPYLVGWMSSLESTTSCTWVIFSVKHVLPSLNCHPCNAKFKPYYLLIWLCFHVWLIWLHIQMYHIEMKNILCRQSEIGLSIGYYIRCLTFKNTVALSIWHPYWVLKVAAIMKFGEHVYLINQIQCEKHL